MQNIPALRIIKKIIFKASKHQKEITHHRKRSGSPKTSAQKPAVLGDHGEMATIVTQEQCTESKYYLC